MDLSSLPAVEAGQVTLLEFTWPWPPGGVGDPTTCICYVVTKRAEGFVLCLPTGFLPGDVLQEGLVNDSPEGLRRVASSRCRRGHWGCHCRPPRRACPCLERARPCSLRWGSLPCQGPWPFPPRLRRSSAGPRVGSRDAARGQVRLPDGGGGATSPTAEAEAQGEADNSGHPCPRPGCPTGARAWYGKAARDTDSGHGRAATPWLRCRTFQPPWPLCYHRPSTCQSPFTTSWGRLLRPVPGPSFLRRTSTTRPS